MLLIGTFPHPLVLISICGSNQLHSHSLENIKRQYLVVDMVQCYESRLSPLWDFQHYTYITKHNNIWDSCLQSVLLLCYSNCIKTTTFNSNGVSHRFYWLTTSFHWLLLLPSVPGTRIIIRIFMMKGEYQTPMYVWCV